MWDRDQAIAHIGLAHVEAVDRLNCEPTNRAGFNGSCQGDDSIEWSASLPLELDGIPVTLTVYYYTDAEDEVIATEQGWDCVTFTPKRYELI